ncbi:uncharacterized protein LOC124156864 [Ischnura elegans]|uniref:uncharacterized protein LOC124156864 n=1 Tax=Ischnura elegans TaxID=197161 RepID=UPI001ED8A327|nr:uncharacterized protein LOC124156864 [Ischnura elegans]XP_046387311.1 uncharacterized protein LOC124156864 [Ischnura elegans]
MVTSLKNESKTEIMEGRSGKQSDDHQVSSNDSILATNISAGNGTYEESKMRLFAELERLKDVPNIEDEEFYDPFEDVADALWESTTEEFISTERKVGSKPKTIPDTPQMTEKRAKDKATPGVHVEQPSNRQGNTEQRVRIRGAINNPVVDRPRRGRANEKFSVCWDRVLSFVCDWKFYIFLSVVALSTRWH